MSKKFGHNPHAHLTQPIQAMIEHCGNGWYEFSPCDLGECIYFLVGDGEVVYVGQSPYSAEGRAIDHLKSGKVFEKVIVVSYQGTNQERVSQERGLIDYIRPKYNSCRGKRPNQKTEYMIELPAKAYRKLKKMCDKYKIDMSEAVTRMVEDHVRLERSLEEECEFTPSPQSQPAEFDLMIEPSPTPR